MTGIRITKLDPAQWRVHRELRLEALRTDPLAFGMTYEESAAQPDELWQARLRSTLAGDGSWTLFALDGDTAVGMIGAFIDTDPTTAQIVAVYVTPSARGKGVGRLLIDGILAELRRYPTVRRADLHVNATQTAAIALYTSAGFVRVASETGDARDAGVVVQYRMSRSL